MKPVKVSVIIPVYNTELYVRQTIQSILGQTLYDIEIITVNDGSTDNSLSILSELAKQDNRIKIFTHSNQGLSVSRNVGIEKASGEFIYFMDSDDLLDHDTLEICYQKCTSEQLDFVFFDAESFCEVKSTFRKDVSGAMLFSQPIRAPRSIVLTDVSTLPIKTGLGNSVLKVCNTN